MLNRWIIVLLFALATAPAQDSEAARKRFLGTWQGKFNGEVFLTVQLEAGKGIEGTISPGRITVDKDGEIVAAEALPEGHESDLMRVRLDGDRLTFEADDHGDLIKLEMRLTGDGKAELRFVSARAKIKPIRLERS